MNELMKQIVMDYGEVLSSWAGRRVLGSIFYDTGLNDPLRFGDHAEMAALMGMRNVGLHIARLVREADPHGVALCEEAYQELRRGIEETLEGRGSDGEDAGEYCD